MIALNVDNQSILRLTACPSNEILEAKAAAREIAEVQFYNTETSAMELLQVSNLHHEKDGWGVDHLVGLVIFEVRPRYGQPYEPRFVPVTFLDNEMEANPLSLH